MNKKEIKKLAQDVADQSSHQKIKAGYGIVMEYDPRTNTAVVLMSNQGSDEPGEILTGVMCPTYIGIQAVAPERGRPCWVAFKDDSQTFPVIVSFFNHMYDKFDYNRQTRAKSPLPFYMLGM